MKLGKGQILKWSAAPLFLFLAASGCASLNHTHPDLATNTEALNRATQAAEQAAAAADLCCTTPHVNET